jgi:hypothetical protein
MESAGIQNIIQSIIETVVGVSVIDDITLTTLLKDINLSCKISDVLGEQLGISLYPPEVVASGSLAQLSALVESRLIRDSMGRTLVDIYTTVERLTRDELRPDINFHWYARWDDLIDKGCLLTSPDGYDAVEIVMRIENEFGFGIPNKDAEAMQTVGQTVRYLWTRSCAQSFVLRQRPESVCHSTFIFHEVRRLLIIRGGVSRKAVRLDARLGDLLPSWHIEFWKEVQSIFQAKLPQRCLFAFGFRPEKQTTVKELVRLIESSQL